MNPNEIDSLRIHVWLEELKHLTGCQTIKALATQLDADSFWADGDGLEHQSKWYQYSKGAQVPSHALVARLQAQVVGATFDLHHPVWTLLRRDCSERTWSRIRSRFGKHWMTTLTDLAQAPCDSLRPSLDLVNALRLHELSYLDSLALFACGRRSAEIKSDHDRARQIEWLLWTLPVLYADDLIWHVHSHEELEAKFSVVDRGLGLPDMGSRAAKFSRANEIVWSYGDMSKHVCRYPSALRTSTSLRRFLSARWANFYQVVSAD
jgi:hypothetical protein